MKLQRIMQVPSSGPFAADADVPSFIRHLGEDGFAEAHGGLDNAADRHPTGRTRHYRPIHHISSDDADLCASLTQGGHELLCFWLSATGSTEENKISPTTCHHPTTEAATKVTQAPNEKVHLPRVENCGIFGLGYLMNIS